MRSTIGLVAAAFPIIILGGCPTAPQGPAWHVVLHGLPAALLSASGTSATDLYAVGGDPEDGKGPLVVHYDGQRWRRLETGASGDLWWITDRIIDGGWFLVGQGGLILRYEPGAGFDQHASPGTETLFGVWGIDEDHVFAVGGFPDEPDDSGVIWRYDGNQWTAEDLSGIDPDGVPVLWKVWGRSNNEVYAVGERGTILRYDGSTWTQLSSPTTRTLFTVHGNAGRVVACGGRQTGTIVERVGSSFEDVTPAGALQMNGVFVPADGEAVTVGLDGAVAMGTASAWMLESTGLTLDLNVSYHAAWGDPDGGIWAVGGNLFVDPPRDGVIAYYGTDDVATELEP